MIVVTAALALGCQAGSGSGGGRAGAGDANKPKATAAPNARSAPGAAGGVVLLEIRKLSVDGKEVKNRIHVSTPPGDAFNVTEQVGATQFQVSGTVKPLPDGKYRVAYMYAETSAAGRRQLQSIVDATPGKDENLGGLVAEEGTEAIVLTLATREPAGR